MPPTAALVLPFSAYDSQPVRQTAHPSRDHTGGRRARRAKTPDWAPGRRTARHPADAQGRGARKRTGHCGHGCHGRFASSFSSTKPTLKASPCSKQTRRTQAKAASGGGRGKGARTQWSPGDPEAPRQVPRCQTGGCRPSSLAGSLRRAPRLPFAAPRFGTPLPWGADHPSIPGSSGHASPASTEPGGAPAVETLHPHWTALHGNARQSPTPPPPNSAASIHPSIHPSHHHHARRHHGVRGGTEPGA